MGWAGARLASSLPRGRLQSCCRTSSCRYNAEGAPAAVSQKKAYNVKGLHMQLASVFAGIGLATVFDRALIMPPLACYCDRYVRAGGSAACLLACIACLHCLCCLLVLLACAACLPAARCSSKWCLVLASYACLLVCCWAASLLACLLTDILAGSLTALPAPFF